MKIPGAFKKVPALGFGAIFILVALLSSCGGGGGDDVPSTGSANAYLASLVVSGGTLAPNFTPATLAYTTVTASNVPSIDITGNVAEANATMKVNNTATVSGAAQPVPIIVGTNAIPVAVTAADGITTKTYTITVTRP